MQENLDLMECQITTFSYRGWVCVTTFGMDPGEHEGFCHTEDFVSDNLLEAKERAISWYKETLKGLEREGKYFLPFASPQDFVVGMHAAFFLVVSLVESCGSDEHEYDLIGADEQTMTEGREMEALIFELLQ